MKTYYCAVFVFVAVLAVGVNSASATPVSLGLSNRATDGFSASVLPSTITFSVSGTTLTLTIHNTSDYYINGVWFNVSDNVTGLNLNGSNPNWSRTFSKNNITDIAGYGKFDVKLADSHNKTKVMTPGETRAFTFTIVGTGSFSESNFSSQLTTGTGIPSYVAAEFDTAAANPTLHAAYGIYATPEPATIAILALGGLGLMRKRKR